MHTTNVLATFTRRQLGLVTHEQASSALTRGQIEGRRRRGALEVVRVGVDRLGGAPDGWDQRLLAACLAAGADARASFRTAAGSHRLVGFDRDLLEITVDRRRVRLPGVVVHDSRFDGPRHRTTVGPIPVTSVARTLCDLTVVAPVGVVARAGDDALRRGIVTLRQWATVARQLQHRGRRRSTVTRTLVDERLTGPELGDSPPELRIARLLRRAGLPAPAHQHRVRLATRTIRIDLAHPSEMIAIEYDGWDHHRTRSAFDSDRARANELELLDWCVLRFTSKFSDREIVETVETALLAAGVTRAA
jgi:very-short-patch-repair endonuclease